jgi:hypothetical protein
MITISELSPSLAIRISRAQLLSLITSLTPIVPVACSELYHFNGGTVVPWAVLPRNIELFHDPLISLWKRFNLMAANDQERYRTRLNAFEASMCGMALRAAARTERTNKAPGGSRVVCRRSELMCVIENHRRRAIRRFKSSVGAEASADTATELRAYQSLITTDLFRRWPKYRFGSPEHYKQRVNEFVAYAKERLEEAGPPIPPDREIRRLVRSFLRYIRRGRYAFSIPQLLDDKELAMSVLAAFILQRWSTEEGNPTDLLEKTQPPRASRPLLPKSKNEVLCVPPECCASH